MAKQRGAVQGVGDRRARVEVESLCLVARCQAGDERAAGELCALWMPPLRRHFEAALGDRHGADDAAQQVLMQVLAALPKYRSAGLPFGSWVHRVARNHFLNHLRSAGRVEAMPPSSIAQLREREEGWPGAPSGWLTDESLAVAYEGLSEVQRRVLALKFVFELSSAEIAALLDLSADNVRQLQRRALRTLRRQRAAVADRGRPASSLRRDPTMPVLHRRRRVLVAT